MKANYSLPALALVGVALFPLMADAQRGVGDPVGVGRQPVTPIVVPVAGTLKEIHIGPCEHTTGRSTLGTHLMVDTADQGTVNVHLGPTQRVDGYVSQLALGEPIAVDTFETPKLPDGHRVAQKVSQAGTTFVLRDDNLRPVWAPRRTVAYYGPSRGVYVEYSACPVPPYRGPYRYSAGYGYRGGDRAGYGRGGGYGYRYGPRAAYYGPRGRRVYYGRWY